MTRRDCVWSSRTGDCVRRSPSARWSRTPRCARYAVRRSSAGAGNTSCDLGLDFARGALGDLARADAAGADVHLLGCAVDDRTHVLDVRVPTTLGATVRERDVHAERRLLTADIADGCHDESLPGRGRLGATGLNRMSIVAFGAMTSPLTLSPREL